jgi:hypothetical protein
MEKVKKNGIEFKKSCIVPILILSAMLISCSELAQIREYDDNPLCREMRRTCKEYSDYQKLTDGKKSQRLNELKEDCDAYSKTCGKSIQRAGE